MDDMTKVMIKGSVKWFNVKRGFGFITDERNRDFFVHHSEILAEGFRKLSAGELVQFLAEEDVQGRLVAKRVMALAGSADEETKNMG